MRFRSVHLRCIDVAEYGIAAHWKYKENNNTKGLNKEEEKLSWLREVLEWQRDMDDNKEVLSLLKTNLDLFAEQVYCLHRMEMSKTLRMVRHRSILHIQSIVQSVIRWLEPGSMEDRYHLIIICRMVIV